MSDQIRKEGLRHLTEVNVSQAGTGEADVMLGRVKLYGIRCKSHGNRCKKQE